MLLFEMIDSMHLDRPSPHSRLIPPNLEEAPKPQGADCCLLLCLSVLDLPYLFSLFLLGHFAMSVTRPSPTMNLTLTRINSNAPCLPSDIFTPHPAQAGWCLCRQVP